MLVAAASEEISHGVTLAIILANPIYVATDGGPRKIMVPAQLLEQEGLSAEEYLASVAELHRLGYTRWDPLSRVHMLTMLPDPDALK